MDVKTLFFPNSPAAVTSGLSDFQNQHSNAFQTPIANTGVYKCSFFPQTIRDSLISSVEDAEDCVAKFTSLVRAITGPCE